MNELTITIESVNKYGMSFWAGVESTNLGAYGRTAWQALTEAVGLAVRDAELKAQKAQEPGALADQRWEAKCKAEEVKGSAGMATKLTVKADALMELFSSGGLIYSRNGYWYYNSGRVHATQAKAILSAGYIKEFRQTGPFKKFYELTDAGREYASEHGWLPAESIPNGQPAPTTQAQASDVAFDTEYQQLQAWGGRAAAEHTLVVAAETPVSPYGDYDNWTFDELARAIIRTLMTCDFQNDLAELHMEQARKDDDYSVWAEASVMADMVRAAYDKIPETDTN